MTCTLFEIHVFYNFGAIEHFDYLSILSSFGKFYLDLKCHNLMDIMQMCKLIEIMQMRDLFT